VGPSAGTTNAIMKRQCVNTVQIKGEDGMSAQIVQIYGYAI